MSKSKAAITTSLLPQFQESAAIMERFLVAAHVDGASIERSPNNEKIKFVDGTELSTDVLNYFTANKENFRAGFTRGSQSKT